MSSDDDILAKAARSPIIHPRVREQGLAPEGDQIEELARAIPRLRPFGSNHYASVRVILDWDHRLPVELVVLRVYAAYSGHEARALDTRMRAREQAIDADNLYPEFDLPDYGEIDASEAYAGVIKPGSFDIHDFRFFSPWRKEVRHGLAREAVSAVKRLDAYKEAYRRRNNEALGGAVVVGWAPPCLAESEDWAIEVWLLTEFDGQGGKALVFMVDADAKSVTRQYFTDVHLA